jgi:hypothetical protein
MRTGDDLRAEQAVRPALDDPRRTAVGLGRAAGDRSAQLRPDRRPLLLEKGRFPQPTLRALRDLGHRVVEGELPTGLQLIRRDSGTLQGGADPRKEDVLRGD